MENKSNKMLKSESQCETIKQTEKYGEILRSKSIGCNYIKSVWANEEVVMMVRCLLKKMKSSDATFFVPLQESATTHAKQGEENVYALLCTPLICKV